MAPDSELEFFLDGGEERAIVKLECLPQTDPRVMRV